MAIGTSRSQNTAGDWLVVATSAVGLAISVIGLYGMGVFIGPLEAEFGWRRSEITSGLLIVSVVAVIGSPLVGLLVDKIGSRGVAISGVLLYCGSMASLGQVGDSVWLWRMVWTLVALGALLIAPVVWTKAVALRFDERRGVALGLALCGASVTLVAIPSTAYFLISSYGWRTAYTVLGLAPAFVALPMIFFFIRSPDAALSDQPGSERSLRGVSIRAGFLSTHFCRIAVAGFGFTAAIIGLVVHFVPVLVDSGVDTPRAAFIAGGLGLGSIAGRIGFGLLIDRFGGPLVGAVGFILPVFGCLMLLYSGGSEIWFVAVAILIGVSLGAEIDILSYLAARYFGLAHYGVLFGSLAGLLTLGSGVGAEAAASVHDWFGSYDPFLWAIIPIFVIGALLIGSLGDYPVFDVPEPS